ncbi:hypothetical protein ABZ832_15090 [Streptantibioticus parmotrematis]|uniref:hypothetical protein n=1 Tax=Streptantibioticus parmotrematis TaxID=2873249 RepID=UPI0033D4C398
MQQVAVSDEETPQAVLRRLRADVWGKDGDTAGPLPEAATMRSWGGRSLILPTGTVRRAGSVCRDSAPAGCSLRDG